MYCGFYCFLPDFDKPICAALVAHGEPVAIVKRSFKRLVSSLWLALTRFDSLCDRYLHRSEYFVAGFGIKSENYYNRSYIGISFCANILLYLLRLLHRGQLQAFDSVARGLAVGSEGFAYRLLQIRSRFECCQLIFFVVVVSSKRPWQRESWDYSFELWTAVAVGGFTLSS